MPQPGSGRARLQPPSKGLVLFALVVTYAAVCGLTSLRFGPIALLLSGLLLLMQAAVAAETVDVRHPSIPCLACFWAASVVAAASVGIWNYRTAYAPYSFAKSGRYYEEVSASTPASVLADAGVIGFDNTATLDDSLSVGLRLFGSTYCAAPVLSKGAADQAGGAAPAAVQFWAIGQDCCGRRGGFTCDSAGQLDAHSGIVWHELSSEMAPAYNLDAYMKAVQASCALNGMQAAASPVLLRWVANPKQLLLGWFTRSLLVWIASSVAFGLLASLLVFLTDHYFDVGLRVASAGLAHARQSEFDAELYTTRPGEPALKPVGDIGSVGFPDAEEDQFFRPPHASPPRAGRGFFDSWISPHSKA